MQCLADAVLTTSLLDGRFLRGADALSAAFSLLSSSLHSSTKRREGAGARFSASAVLWVAIVNANCAAKAAGAKGDSERAAIQAQLASKLKDLPRRKAGGSAAADAKGEIMLQVQLSKEDKIRVVALRGHEKAINIVRSQLQLDILQRQAVGEARERDGVLARKTRISLAYQSRAEGEVQREKRREAPLRPSSSSSSSASSSSALDSVQPPAAAEVEVSVSCVARKAEVVFSAGTNLLAIKEDQRFSADGGKLAARGPTLQQSITK